MVPTQFKTSLIVEPTPVALSPVIAEADDEAHVNVVPATVLLSEMPVPVPEHIEGDEGVAIATGVGLTVTTGEIELPEQLEAVGITTYVTVPGVDVVADIISAITALEPEAEAPEAFTDEELQLNVVPDTLPLKDKEAISPEQIAIDDGVDNTSGNGFTVTTGKIALPVHPDATGVTR